MTGYPAPQDLLLLPGQRAAIQALLAVATQQARRNIAIVLAIEDGWIIGKHAGRPRSARDEVHPRIVVSRIRARDCVMPEIQVAQRPGEALSVSRGYGRHENSRLLQRPGRS